MRRHRAVRRAILTVLALGLGPAIAARADDPWVGRKVITRYGAVLRVGRQVVDDEGRGKELARGKEQRKLRVYRVEHAEGPWLWLVAEQVGVRGWVKAEWVIPFDRAIDYFTAEIRRQPGRA